MQTRAGSDNLEIRTRVKWLMILRATVVTVLLGSLAVLQFIQEREPVPAIYLIVIATYFLTIVYSIIFYRVKNLAAFAYVQILGDALIETGVVFATGGVESAFSFTYIFSVIAAGIILYRRGSFLVATLAGVSYGALAWLQYYGLVLQTPARGFTESEVLYNIFLNLVAFYTVAFLASSLSERLRATKEALYEKSTDLRELQSLNESIVRSMADGMVTVGLDGRVTAFNKAAEEITGVPAQSAKGTAFSEIFNWLGIETFFVDIEAAGRLPYRYELVYARQDKELVLGMTLSPLRNEQGVITGLLGVFQDLTPMKEMEEEIKRKDRLALIGELSAGVAHEIRNPLASLSGSLQILKGDLDLKEEDARLMEIALGEMDRLNNIVTDFLTYARPKAPAKEGCDLVGLVRDTAGLIINSKELREDIRLETDLPDKPIILKADPAQLKQVFINLCINAVQSIPAAGTVRIKASYKGAGRAEVLVSDDGEGIKKEDIDRIFYPFYSTKEGGYGLGLAIVYRIIEDHGGRIRVESEPERGTTFFITLPTEGYVLR